MTTDNLLSSSYERRRWRENNGEREREREREREDLVGAAAYGATLP